jgi:predicted glycosyltransferase
MRVLIDILHPAHVHIFKNFINEMKKKGHVILITARDKEVTLKLLDAYRFKYIIISKSKKGFGLVKEALTRGYKLYKISRRFKPDILIGNVGISIAPVGFITRIPTVVFHNNESAKITNPIVYRLAKYVVTSKSYENSVPNKNHITYDGCHELAYLHPNWF